MKILFYRYGSICEPDLIHCFQALGLQVIEDTTQITKKNTTPSETVNAVSELLKKHPFLFVFTINFFPAVSDTCQIYQVPYVCWTVDCPVMELFSPSLSNSCNRIFMFDRAQYEYFRHANPESIFHLPLATNVGRWDTVIKNADSQVRSGFRSDVSFVGSLYEEKDPYAKISGLSQYTKGYVEGMIEAQLQVYGYNMLEDLLLAEPENSRPSVMQDFMEHVPDLTRSPYAPYFQPSFIMAHHFIGMHAAVIERHRLLQMLSGHHKVDLYTLSNTERLPMVHNRGGAKTLTEMPLIFHESRINLNMTIRPIQTGLSLRVFDILGCGGFLLTNYQEELPEYYEIGKDVEVFSSGEELVEKADYYLSHEEQRKKIAENGYEKTRAFHTYETRVAQMIRIINRTL